jgi:hypothetical protein
LIYFYRDFEMMSHTVAKNLDISERILFLFHLVGDV